MGSIINQPFLHQKFVDMENSAIDQAAGLFTVETVNSWEGISKFLLTFTDIARCLGFSIFYIPTEFMGSLINLSEE